MEKKRHERLPPFGGMYEALGVPPPAPLPPASGVPDGRGDCCETARPLASRFVCVFWRGGVGIAGREERFCWFWCTPFFVDAKVNFGWTLAANPRCPIFVRPRGHGVPSTPLTPSGSYLAWAAYNSKVFPHGGHEEIYRTRHY